MESRSSLEDPLQKFLALLGRAKADPRIVEPTAMTLATVGADGRPSARVVLLKDADEDGLVFYTNLDSRKGREALARPDVALVFWWGQLESQVRFEGRAERVSDEEADAYFATRARGSQLGAWASAQSRPLASRAELEANLLADPLARDGFGGERLAGEDVVQAPPDVALAHLAPGRPPGEEPVVVGMELAGEVGQAVADDPLQQGLLGGRLPDLLRVAQLGMH